MTNNNNTYNILPDTLKQIKTGFAEFDEKIGGFGLSSLIIIAARPAMGKTTFALHLAKHFAIEQNMPALYFSLEKSKEALSQQFIYIETGVGVHKLNSGKLTNDEKISINKAVELFLNAPIYIDDTPRITPAKIFSRCSEFKEKPSLVIIDLLQLINADKKDKKRKHEIIEIEIELRKFAHEMNIPIVVLSSVSRGCEGRVDKRPKISDLRCSSKYVDDIYFLYNEGYYTLGKLINPTEIIKAGEKDKSRAFVCNLNIN